MKRFYYDIKAFLILRSEVRKHRNDADWARLNLRHDWLYRIYTVINPSEKDKGDDEAMINMKAMDRLAPVNKYIATFGIAEIVSLSVEKIPDSDSFLAVYYQIFNWFSPWRIFSRSVSLIGIIWALIYFWPEINSLFS
jgi:hypothetical protein